MVRTNAAKGVHCGPRKSSGGGGASSQLEMLLVLVMAAVVVGVSNSASIIGVDAAGEMTVTVKFNVAFHTGATVKQDQDRIDNLDIPLELHVKRIKFPKSLETAGEIGGELDVATKMVELKKFHITPQVHIYAPQEFHANGGGVDLDDEVKEEDPIALLLNAIEKHIEEHDTPLLWSDFKKMLDDGKDVHMTPEILYRTAVNGSTIHTFWAS